MVNCLATDATYSRDTHPSQLKIHPLKGRVSGVCCCVIYVFETDQGGLVDCIFKKGEYIYCVAFSIK